MPLFCTQSAAVLPSLAPHDSKARLQAVTTRRGSWRSHVHRTNTAQRVQSFKRPTANVGGRGGRPSSFSGGFKGGILFEKRIPPLPRAPRQAGPPYSARGAAKLTHLCQVRKKEHSMDYTMKVIARIHSDFPEKFGIPRQSGLVPFVRRSSSNRSTAIPTRCAASRAFRTCGSSGSSLPPCATHGRRRCARRALAATSAWAFLRRARRSGRTPSDFPA